MSTVIPILIAVVVFVFAIIIYLSLTADNQNKFRQSKKFHRAEKE